MSYNNLSSLIHKSLGELKDDLNKHLGHEAYFLYSQLYLKYGYFYRRNLHNLQEICQTYNYSEPKLLEVLRELETFNLIRHHHESKEVVSIEFIPPLPLSLMKGTMLSRDLDHYYLAIGDVFLVEGEEGFIPLKYHFINLNTNEYDEIIQGIEIGDSLYFVAEALQREDGTWKLRNESNIMTNIKRT